MEDNVYSVVKLPKICPFNFNRKGITKEFKGNPIEFEN